MAGSISTRLSASQGRRFGLTVGIAFVAVALLLRVWRNAWLVPMVFGALGASLVLAGLLIPTWLGPVEHGWMRMAHMISRVTTPIVMGVIYFVVITPFGVMRRMFGKNALIRRPDDPRLAGGGFWVSRGEGDRKSFLTRQF
jgi:hypothetical protein